MERTDPEFKALMQAGSAAIGAVVGGDSGSTAALNGTKYNYLTHAQIDTLNNALAACTTDSCRSDAIAEAKKQSVQNDVALAIVCNAGGSSACYQGLGALESYTDSPVVPREMRGDQTTDHHLEQSGYFGNIGFLGGVAASVYASLPQDGETGAYLSGAGAKYGNSLLPFVGNDEGRIQPIRSFRSSSVARPRSIRMGCPQRPRRGLGSETF